MKLPLLLILVLLLILTAPAALGQLWGGVIAPSRAIDYTQAGTIIPLRPNVCASFNPGATASAINTAIASCPSGQTVFLTPGTYNLTIGLVWNNKSNVTVRGAGADQTFLVFTGKDACTNGPNTTVCMRSADVNYFQTPTNAANWTAGYVRGATVITLSNSLNLFPGNPLILDMLNDPTWLVGTTYGSGARVFYIPNSTMYVSLVAGNTGNTPPSSPTQWAVDASQIYICDTDAGKCALDGPSGSARIGRGQMQVVTVISCSPACPNSGSTQVTISPGLYMPNWDGLHSPGAWWATSPVTADGIEDVSIDATGAGSATAITFFNCLGCWAKGVLAKNPGRSAVWMWYSPHSVVRDSYFYGNRTNAQESYGLEPFGMSDGLFENNIFQKIAAPITVNGPCSGCVASYNFSINQYYTPSSTWQQQSLFLHTVDDFLLAEGNIGAGIYSDLFHGPHHFITLFRNRYDGLEKNNGVTTSEHTNPSILYPLSRYFNLIGNVFGTTPKHTLYQLTASGAPNDNIAVYTFNYMSAGGGYNDDPTTLLTSMRWGNYDVVNAANRFVSAEVPSGITGFPNSVPASNALPPSFYLSAKPAFWSTVGSIAPPWPGIGPDVTGGDIAGVGGHAYKNPAQLCYEHLGGNADGTSAILSNFSEAACYYASPVCAKATFGRAIFAGELK